MLNWYVLSIINLFGFGIQYFLYKVSAEKKCNTAWTSFSFMATVAILSSIFFFVFEEKVNNLSLLLIMAFFDALIFLTVTILRIETLKYIAASVSLPIIRMSSVFAVIFSLFYFKETLNVYQSIGIIIAFLTIFILAKYESNHKDKNKNIKKGFILTFFALIFSSIATIYVKFVAINVNLMGFMAISYIMNSIFSFGLRNKLQSEKENPNHKNALIIGFFIGLANFVGFYALLKALSIGPLSIIATIKGLSFIVAVALSVLIYKEKLTPARIIGLVLAIVAVVLMGV